MCEIWDEIRNEGKNEGKIEGKVEGKLEEKNELAVNLIKDGTLSLDKIAELTGLSIERVRELAGNLSA